MIVPGLVSVLPGLGGGVAGIIADDDVLLGEPAVAAAGVDIPAVVAEPALADEPFSDVGKLPRRLLAEDDAGRLARHAVAQRVVFGHAGGWLFRLHGRQRLLGISEPGPRTMEAVEVAGELAGWRGHLLRRREVLRQDRELLAGGALELP